MRTNNTASSGKQAVAGVAAIWRAPRCAVGLSSSAAKTPTRSKHQYLLRPRPTIASVIRMQGGARTDPLLKVAWGHHAHLQRIEAGWLTDCDPPAQGATAPVVHVTAP